VEDTRDRASGPGRHSLVDTNNPHTVSWLGGITKIALKDNFNGARELTRRSSLWKLLNCDLLRVDVCGETKLGRQQMAIVISDRVNGGGRRATVRSDVAVVTRHGDASVRAVVHGANNLWTHKGTAGDDAPKLNELAKQRRGQLTRRDAVCTKLSSECNVESFLLVEYLGSALLFSEDTLKGIFKSRQAVHWVDHSAAMQLFIEVRQICIKIK